MPYTAETVGYLAKSAFLRALAASAGVGAVAGGAAGALNNDGHTGLGSRVLHGALGGAVGGAAFGSAPALWNKGHVALNAARGVAAPTLPKAMTSIEHRIMGSVGGVVGGVANTGGDSH